MTTRAATERRLAEIVGRASTIDERLGENLEHADGDTADAAGARLEAWCEAVAKGDWDRFRLRLAWDGLDLETARRALCPVRLPEDAVLPEWARLLEDALNQGPVECRGDAWPVGSSFLRTDEPLPFEDVLAPFVVSARRRVAALTPEGLLSEGASADLERGLLMSLVSASAETLMAEFEVMRGREQTSWARVISLSEDPDGSSLYEEFARRMTDDGLFRLFEKYPVLARRLGTITHLWVDATAELLERLKNDHKELEDAFGQLGRVVVAEPSLSDPHRGRRRVVALTFASGRRLVYKPKNLGTEAAYYRLLEWLNERGVPLDFKLLKVLDRSTHGWVEFAEHLPVQGRSEARRYYERAGMLLCLFYTLEGTDCHYENVVASGEYPVLVDAETLMHHRARVRLPDDGSGAQALANDQLDYSVLRTGLLPRWQVSGDGRIAYDVSGLGDTPEQELPYKAPRWVHVNTDRMAVEPVPLTLTAQANVPRLGGTPLSLREFGPQVVDGFKRMYRFLMNNREAFSESDPLRALARERVRFVYRPTKVYALLLNSLQSRPYLRDGADQSIRLEQLGRSQIPSHGPLPEERPLLWPVFAAERRAMERGDVPFFTARADRDALTVGPGEEIEDCFVEPSFELVDRILKDLGEEDLKRQVAFVEGSLYTHLARDATAARAMPAVGADSASDGPPSPEAFLAPALALAKRIQERAIRAADGSAAWISPQYLIQAERFQLRPMDEDLYGGVSGVALFLAAADGFAPGESYDGLAMAALRPLRGALRDRPDVLAEDMGLGGGSGLGSVLYTLARVSRLLDEPDMLEEARRAATLVTDARIAADASLDVLSGSAGAVLGLLALHEALGGDDAVLRRAAACGEHLVSARTVSRAGLRAWATFDGRLTTGFSHGAAGISYALLRLYQHTGDPRLVEAAREGIDYEATTYSAEAGNWADYWKRDEPLYVWSWCHGAPGIGLARLCGLPILDAGRVREDIELAISATQGFGLQLMDHLCCGNLGRADMMLEAGLRLSRPDLVSWARAHAWRAVKRAEGAGGFVLHPLLPNGVDSPGLFQGTAGIGYELLRMARPDALPSVLAWG